MIGETLSHFKITAKLGEGGMGEVYRATDTALDREVAIKVLPDSVVADTDRLARFEREAKVLASLNHPNIAGVHQVEDVDGRRLLVMELAEGETLAARLTRGSVPLDEALPIALQVAEALEAAHDHGIVHRDLKPANVMVAPNGAVKILDFGLAKALAAPDEKGTDSSLSPTLTAQMTQPGVLLGTVLYMSPEQARGDEADQRSDLWALGVVLHEMLTGTNPFARGSMSEVMAAILTEEVEAPIGRAAAPKGARDLLSSLLAKDPTGRPESAAAVRERLVDWNDERAGAGRSAGKLASALRRPAWLAGAAALLMLLGLVGYRSMRRAAGIERAHTELVPEIQRLADEGDYVSAVAVAEEAEHYIAGDPALDELWLQISMELWITSDPPEADVYIKEYASIHEPWQALGQTPIEEHRVPIGLKRLRIEKAGYITEYRALRASNTEIELVESGILPDGMLRVPAHARASPWLGGLNPLALLELKPFLVDRYEVTNAEFQRFVNDGGYESDSLWAQDFIGEGEPIEWRDAVASFVDATGRPGPAGWQVGSFPPGQGDYPVSGVSWYEAAAYCASVDKNLPTIYHWITISGARGMAAGIVPLSNSSSDGAAPVGEHQGMGPFGTFDTAGNVSEWCWNESTGDRYLLGGSWRDPGYVFGHAQVRHPLDRSADNGIRCVRYLGSEGIPEESGRPVEFLARDYRREEPVPDAVFAVYKEQFAYDAMPLNAVVEEEIIVTEGWTAERVSLDAAYNDERLIVYLMLPKRGQPPYQTVIYFPGTSAIHRTNLEDDLRQRGLPWQFIVKSGRALVWPVYKSTYERHNDLPTTWPDMSRAYVDRVVQWVQDFRLTVDYLETRDDIQSDRLAYFGVSWGGRLGAIIPAVEPRLRASILYSGGLASGRARPEADQINYVGRVTTPTLMLNGRLDSIEPVEEAQLPMYELLGVPEEDKRHRIYDSGHMMPLNPIIRETVDWLDRYLGPVSK